ncbi:proteasome assembly chaperone 4 [Olea europaea subsp. europaea]|uniref:Proteasome assembly chaperone 4 n=1 Tax=Olea europaea subsp. europaea TaxID=158383 RepID=A0A8S0R4J2_OLEEU|nr:proteasome assembly chaperone 4 [Olea europaea subsp. europaea]
MDPNESKEAFGNGVETATQSVNQLTMKEHTTQDGGGVQVTCFSEVSNEVTLHFQIIRLQKQIYAWIGCSSAKFGHLYAAARTRPSNTVSVTSLIGGTSDNTGSGVARRLVLKTGLNIILACDLPKNSPMLEVLSFSHSLLYFHTSSNFLVTNCNLNTALVSQND